MSSTTRAARPSTFLSAWLLAALLLLAGPPASAATIETVAGTGEPENNGDEGDALRVNIGQPFGVEIGPDGALYVTEVQHHRVRRIDLQDGSISTVAGSGEKGYSGDNGPAVKARMNEPYEVRFDQDGHLFVVEMQNHIVRRVDRQTGIITTVAGTGEQGYAGDNGPAVAAKFSQPHSIALDHAGGLYIADIGNHRIRRVDLKTGVVTSVAGSQQRRLPEDGQPARGRPILGPRALCFHDGVLWIALREGHSVWKMPLESGVLHHVAGSGEAGYRPARSGSDLRGAAFNGPKGIAVDSQGRVVVVDTENQAIRRIDPQAGRIETIAGSGPQARGYRGDKGPALRCWLDRPHGVCVAPDGRVFIGDTNNHRVRMVK